MNQNTKRKAYVLGLSLAISCSVGAQTSMGLSCKMSVLFECVNEYIRLRQAFRVIFLSLKYPHLVERRHPSFLLNCMRNIKKNPLIPSKVTF